MPQLLRRPLYHRLLSIAGFQIWSACSALTFYLRWVIIRVMDNATVPCLLTPLSLLLSEQWLTPSHEDSRIINSSFPRSPLSNKTFFDAIFNLCRIRHMTFGGSWTHQTFHLMLQMSIGIIMKGIFSLCVCARPPPQNQCGTLPHIIRVSSWLWISELCRDLTSSQGRHFRRFLFTAESVAALDNYHPTFCVTSAVSLASSCLSSKKFANVTTAWDRSKHLLLDENHSDFEKDRSVRNFFALSSVSLTSAYLKHH